MSNWCHKVKSNPFLTEAHQTEEDMRRYTWQKWKTKVKTNNQGLRLRVITSTSFPPFRKRDPSQGNTSKLIPEEHLILMTPVSQDIWQSIKVIHSSNNNPFAFIWGYSRPRHFLTVPCFAPWELLFNLSTNSFLPQL